MGHSWSASEDKIAYPPDRVTLANVIDFHITNHHAQYMYDAALMALVFKTSLVDALSLRDISYFHLSGIMAYPQVHDRKGRGQAVINLNKALADYKKATGTKSLTMGDASPKDVDHLLALILDLENMIGTDDPGE